MLSQWLCKIFPCENTFIKLQYMEECATGTFYFPSWISKVFPPFEDLSDSEEKWDGARVAMDLNDGERSYCNGSIRIVMPLLLHDPDEWQAILRT